MTYMRHKDLTRYFNFNKEVDIETLPKYVIDYLNKDEVIFKAYKTRRDKGVFTDTRMILFDIDPIRHSKKIHVIPYNSISSGTIMFKKLSGHILLSFDSGYQLKLKFVGLSNTDKTDLRKLFHYMFRNVK